MGDEMIYAVACKNCGHVLDKAYEQKERGPDGPAGPWTVSTTPLTPQGRVPVICPECGAIRSWRVPATAEDIAKADAKTKRAARATELTRSLDIDGMFKVPDEVRAAPEVKNALSNLFAPLEGETLKLAQSLAIKVAKSGVVVTADVWIEMYDKAVAKAIHDVAEAEAARAKAAAEAKATEAKAAAKAAKGAKVTA